MEMEFFSFLLCAVVLLYSLCLFPVIFLHVCQAVLFILCLFNMGGSIGTLFCLDIKWTLLDSPSFLSQTCSDLPFRASVSGFHSDGVYVSTFLLPEGM